MNFILNGCLNSGDWRESIQGDQRHIRKGGRIMHAEEIIDWGNNTGEVGVIDWIPSRLNLAPDYRGLHGVHTGHPIYVLSSWRNDLRMRMSAGQQPEILVCWLILICRVGFRPLVWNLKAENVTLVLGLANSQAEKIGKYTVEFLVKTCLSTSLRELDRKLRATSRILSRPSLLESCWSYVFCGYWMIQSSYIFYADNGDVFSSSDNK